ncbi:MAG: serine/threonine-protein kinase, partial [Myxococcota bacterium]
MTSENWQLERYELVERIAVGGMAEVFRAKSYGSHGFEKIVAIKRILPELAASDEFERRFIAEAKMACSLNHVNIVQVFDFSRFGDSLYIVMEYVDGIDLARLLARANDRGESIPLGAALHIAIELFKGLDFAHGRGIIHRDISPPNILLSRSGEVKIADFGIAKAAGVVTMRSRRHIMGKWRYMSPEQTRGMELDGRSDLFSAASVLHELFTGKRLFPGGDAEAIVRNIHDMELPRLSTQRPDVPKEMDDIALRMLARERERRMARAKDAWQALIDVSYANAVKATSMGVADIVSYYADATDATAPSHSPDISMRLIDAIISSELDRARSGEEISTARRGDTIRDAPNDHRPDPTQPRGKRTANIGRITVRDLRVPPTAAEDIHSTSLDHANRLGSDPASDLGQN